MLHKRPIVKRGAEAVQGPLARWSTRRLAQANVQREGTEAEGSESGHHRHIISVGCGSQGSRGSTGSSRRRRRIPHTRLGVAWSLRQVVWSCSIRASGAREEVPVSVQARAGVCSGSCRAAPDPTAAVEGCWRGPARLSQRSSRRVDAKRMDWVRPWPCPNFSLAWHGIA